LILVDSNEPKEFVEELRDAGLSVRQEQLRCYKCLNCGRWFPNTRGKCPNCDTVPIKGETPEERIADITNEKGTFAIERKTERDFWNSLVSKRLYTQMEKMAEAYGSSACVAVEGYLEGIALDHPQHAKWIYSIRAEAQWVYGVHLNDVGDVDGMIKLIEWADRKAGTLPKQRIKIKRQPVDPRIRALANECDNVGLDKARTLAFVFGSLEDIMKTPKETIGMLYGFADKTLDSIETFFKGKIDLGGWTPPKDRPLAKKA
jgi:ERCC4-type nuclease